MELTFEVTLDYGDDEPDAAEPSPTDEDVADWIVAGMADAGFPSLNVQVVRL